MATDTLPVVKPACNAMTQRNPTQPILQVSSGVMPEFGPNQGKTVEIQAAETLGLGSPSNTFHLPTGTLAALTARYEVQQELGSGGMGIVYKARDLETNEIVALKVLRSEVSSNSAVVERFRTELRIAHKVTHKRVCRTYELLKFGDLYTISMEFVEGDSLRSVLERFEGLSIRRSLRMLEQICEGLAEAHAQGIVHRDLKPENIMVERSGDLKIMDFGIARSLELNTGTSEHVVGTPGYMAPEQVQGDKVDSRTDIYALGLIAYELLGGRPTFVADTPLALAYKHVQETPIDLKTVEPFVPDFLNALVMKCLEKDRNRRFETVEMVRDALLQTSQKSEVVSSLRDVAAAPWSRADWLFTAASIACLGMFLLVFVRASITARGGLVEDPAVLARLSLKYAETFGSKPATLIEQESFGLRSLYDYIASTHGHDTTLKLASLNFPFWEWRTVFREADGGTCIVWIDRAGGFRGYRRNLPSPSAVANLPIAEARVKARTMIMSTTGLNVDTWKLVSAGEVVRNGDVADELVWDSEDSYGLHRRVMVRVRGNDVTALAQWHELPSSFGFRKPPNWQIPTAIAISLLVIVLGLVQARHIKWNDRWRLCFTALVFPLGGWGAYWDISSDDSVRPYFFFIVGLVSSLVLFCSTIVIERCLGTAARDKLASLAALVDWRLDKRLWSRAMLRGASLGLILLFANEIMSITVLKYLSGWQESYINIQIQGWYVSRWSPGLQILAAALLACVGLGLIVGVFSSLVWRASSKSTIRIAVPAVIVGLSGIAWYMGAIQPNSYKVLILILEYGFLCWIFVRHDFLTCLTAIFTQSFVWGITSIYFMRGVASHTSEFLTVGGWALTLLVCAYFSSEKSLAKASSRLGRAVS